MLRGAPALPADRDQEHGGGDHHDSHQGDDQNRAGGQSWLEHGVKKSQIMTRVDKVKLGSEQLYKYVVSLINENVKKGLLVDE